VQVIGVVRRPKVAVITGIESFHKQLDMAKAGDNVGVLLRGVMKEDIKRGMCVIKPNALTVRRRFESEIYVLKPDEGGRSKPFTSGYKPQAFVRTADTSCTITLADNVEMAMPGDNLTTTMRLYVPLPLLVGQRFALREGGKTIAAGVVTKLLEDTEEDFKEEEERAAKAAAAKA